MSITKYFENTLLYFYTKMGYMFYLLDIFYQKMIEDLEKEEDNDDLNANEDGVIDHYDIENDIIKIQYFIGETKYIFCIDRKNDMNIKEVYEKLLKKHEHACIDEYLMYAELNGKEITKRLNKYLGPSGYHLKYNNFQIKWFLHNYEIESFSKLSIIDSEGNEKEYKNINNFL